MRKLAGAVSSTVIQATPFRTGLAKSNWQIGINSPISGQTEITGNPQARNDVVIRTFGDNDSRIHITNNLPYIRRLNEGWSAKAPSGFVEKAVQNAVRILKTSKVL